MIALVLIVIFLTVCLGAFALLLGFRLGFDYHQNELFEARMRAAQASRVLHDTVRESFVAMTEEAERRRRP